MSATGTWALQVALVSAIRANAAIMALVENVYDAVPQGANPPFIVVGDGEETTGASFGQVGHDINALIQIWTRDGETTTGSTGASGYKAGKAIANLIVDLLMNTGVTVTGHDAVVIDADSVQSDRPSPDDPSIRLIEVKARILLEDS